MAEQNLSPGQEILNRFNKYRRDLKARHRKLNYVRLSVACYFAVLIIALGVDVSGTLVNLSQPQALTSPGNSLSSIKSDTELTLAQIANLQARQELHKLETANTPPAWLIAGLKLSKQQWNLVLFLIAIPVGFGIFHVYVVVSGKQRPFQKIKPDLTFASAIADSIVSPTSQTAGTSLTTAENSWNHLVLSPHLINSLVLDAQFREIWKLRSDELLKSYENLKDRSDADFFAPLIKDRKFQYLFLSLADQRVFGQRRFRLLLSALQRKIQDATKPENKQQQVGGVAIILALLLIFNTIGQSFSNKTVVVQCKTNSTDQQQENNFSMLLGEVSSAIKAACESKSAEVKPLVSSEKTIEKTFYTSSDKTVSQVPDPAKQPTPPLTIPNTFTLDLNQKMTRSDSGEQHKPEGSEAIALFSPKKPTDTVKVGPTKQQKTWVLSLQPPFRPWPPKRVMITASESSGGESHNLYAGFEPTFDSDLDADVWIESSSNKTLFFWGEDTLAVHIKPHQK